ncbi:MAG TPA: 2-isopropylmalate synthase [Anaerolineae bacterium]|nr:2-isopropylmalate synthase [Anaerolineae bacterium]
MDRVSILDATLYGGGQSPGVVLNLEEKLEIARLLEQMGVDAIQVGFPISSPREFEAARELSRVIRGSAVCALARARQEDIDVAIAALKPAARPRLQIGLGASDSYIEGKLKTTREAALDLAVEAVRRARRYVEDVQYYAADAWRADPAYLYRVLEAVINAGATTVNIADTVGFSTPSEWGALIRGIRENVSNVDQAVIGIHCHNDLGLATANAIEALSNGARQVECAVNGIGERAGTAVLEEVVMILRARGEALGLETGVDTRLIYPLSQLVGHLTGLAIHPTRPLVGDKAFAYTSGVYQQGVLRGRTEDEVVDPSDMGILDTRTGAPLLTGREGLRRRLSQLGFGLDDDEFERVYGRFREIAKKKPDLELRDLEAIVSGETTVYIKETYRLHDVQVMCGSNAQPVAAVCLVGPEQEEVWATRHGNGPVDAAFKAIDSVLGVENELVEFSIQAMTGGLDAVGRVLVRIRAEVPLGDTGRVQQREFLGRGADTDVIVASAKAYVFALNRLLAARRTSRGRLAATSEQVQKALDEMHARYGSAHTGDFMGWSAMRDEDLF